MFEEYFEKEKTKLRQVEKNEILQTPGSIATEVFYVKSGLLRSYLIDDDGKVHVLMFAPEGWIISDIESHTLSETTQLYIDALEDSEIVQVSQVTLNTFTSGTGDNTQIIERLFKRIAAQQNRIILLMSATAMQRYEHFLKTYPQLANRVQLKMIASYLGITPEALSNIRNKIRQQEG